MCDYSGVIGIDANGTPVALSRPPPAKKRVYFSVEAPEVKSHQEICKWGGKEKEGHIHW